jgi:hypothetical protein
MARDATDLSGSRFEVDDATLDWAFKDVSVTFHFIPVPDMFLQNSFDYIHARNIGGGVSNWDHLLSEMMRYVIRVTKTGLY